MRGKKVINEIFRVKTHLSCFLVQSALKEKKNQQNKEGFKPAVKQRCTLDRDGLSYLRADKGGLKLFGFLFMDVWNSFTYKYGSCNAALPGKHSRYRVSNCIQPRSCLLSGAAAFCLILLNGKFPTVSCLLFKSITSTLSIISLLSLLAGELRGNSWKQNSPC